MKAEMLLEHFKKNERLQGDVLGEVRYNLPLAGSEEWSTGKTDWIWAGQEAVAGIESSVIGKGGGSVSFSSKYPCM